MGPAPMPKSVGILDDEEDKNREKNEAKAQASGACVACFLLCWMCYLFIMRKVIV